MKNILLTISSCGLEDPEPIDLLEKNGYRVIFNPHKRKLSQEEVVELFVKYDPVGMVAGVEPLTAEVLGNAKSLKVISRCGVGLDNIDLDASSEMGIRILSTPDAPCQAVTELTITLMLTSLRKVIESDKNIRNGQWIRPMGRLLSGKVVGIVGCGRIGSKVANILRSFDVESIGFDTYITDHRYIKLVSLEELIKVSDIISLHLPYTEETNHFVEHNFLKSMKKDAILINTSRGGLIDEKALYKALQEGHIGCACIDVFENEPYTGELTKLPNVILTPHIGSYAREARVCMEKEAVQNLIEALKTEV